MRKEPHVGPSPTTSREENFTVITLTRRQAHALRGVFRRSALGLIRRSPVPRLVLRAEGRQLRAVYRYGSIAVEHVGSCDPSSDGTVLLPLDALSEFEGRDDTPVVIEAVALDKTIVRWVDRGIPQTREYTAPALDTPAPLPGTPMPWTLVPSRLLDALAEASATSVDGSSRYALDCVLIRAVDAGHEVVATDGHQFLVQGGFRLPWAGDVLVRRSPVFACKALPRDRPLEVGKTAAHIVLQAGPWTLFLDVQTGARFPRVEGAIPGAGMPATRLRLDPADVEFLLPALDRLPGRDGVNSPATLDLNGCVAVRARGEDQPQTTELVLTRSGYDGPPVRLNTNREFLSRALRLGFTYLEVGTPETPLVCRDAFRTYAWQPLSKESAIAPSDDVVRIDSSRCTTTEPAGEGRPTKARTSLNEPRPSNNAPVVRNGAPAHQAQVEAAGAGGLAALIREAEALHEALSDARTRTGRLVVALRRHRKRERLVTSTLATLRELKLPEAVS
jgi:hypothetical protein